MADAVVNMMNIKLVVVEKHILTDIHIIMVLNGVVKRQTIKPQVIMEKGVAVID